MKANIENMRLLGTIVNTANNKDIIKISPHINFADMSILFRFIVEYDKDDGHLVSTLVTNRLKNILGLDTINLFRAAVNNSNPVVTSLHTFTDSVDGSFFDETEEFDESIDFMILSNDMHLYGAFEMFNSSVLNKISAETYNGADLIVIPSSTHEVIICPLIKGVDQRYITALIRTVNQTTILDEDKLSDNAYIFEPCRFGAGMLRVWKEEK